MDFRGFNKFRTNLYENSIDDVSIQDMVDCIVDIVTTELTPEETDEFGVWLYTTYFDDNDNDNDIFELEDIKQMLSVLSVTEDAIYILDDILGALTLDEFDDDSINEALLESVTSYMKAPNRNLKKRKFMANSKMYLFRTKQKRKKENLLSKPKRHREYLINKKRISDYQKSRSTAIKKHLHIVKLRRKVGNNGDKKF